MEGNDPTDVTGVLLPKLTLVPQSNQAFVKSFTVLAVEGLRIKELSCALEVVTEVAGLVMAVKAPDGGLIIGGGRLPIRTVTESVSESSSFSQVME